MIEELRRYVVMSPRPFAIDLANSRGMYLATVDGERLFDWAGYYGSKLLGHNHPGLSDPQYMRRLCLERLTKESSSEPPVDIGRKR